MQPQTLQLIRKVFGRGVPTQIQDSQEKQRRNVEAFLRADFNSGNFNSSPRPADDDSIPSDAFGDW
jgi:hypothetical protein